MNTTSSEGTEKREGRAEEVEGARTDNPSPAERGTVVEESSEFKQEVSKDAILRKLQKLSIESLERLLDQALPELVETSAPSPTVSASSSMNYDNATAKQLVKKFQLQRDTAIATESEGADDDDDGESIEMQEVESVENSDIGNTENGAQEARSLDSGESSKDDAPSAENGESEEQSRRIDASTHAPPVGILPVEEDSRNEGEIIPVEQADNVVADNENRNHVVVNLDLTEDDYSTSSTPTGHLECYLVIANYFGISTYRREEYEALKKGWSWLLKTLYVIFSTAALLQMLRHVKTEGLYAANDTDLKSCVLFGNALIHFLSRCFFIYLISFCAAKISAMLLHLREIMKFQPENEGNTKRFSRVAATMGVLTVAIIAATTIIGYEFLSDWSFTGSIQWRSFEMSETLFFWNVTAFDDKLDDLIDYNFSDLTVSHVVMAVVDGFLDFCDKLQGEVILDLLLLTIMMLLSGWKCFERRIEPQLQVHPNNCTPAEVERAVRHFKALRKANGYANQTLATVFNFTIVQSLFTFATMFVRTLDLKKHFLTMRLIYLGVDVLKASAILLVAVQINWRNGTVTNWLRMMTKYTGPVDVEGILGMTIQAALDDIRENPVGFGMEYFLINQTFLVGFCAAVSSIVSCLAETDNQQAATEQLLRFFL